MPGVIRKLIPLLLVATALGGCSTSSSQPAAGGSSPSPSASPSPTPTASLEQLKAWVEAAALTVDSVGAPKPVNDDPSPTDPFEVCGKPLDANSKIVAAHYWRWARGTHIGYVEHTVAAFQGISGADVLAEVKDKKQACTTYQATDPYGSADLTPQPDYTIATPTCVDSVYAYCVLSVQTAPAKGKGDKTYICTATLVRGPIVDNVLVFGAVPTLDSATQALNVAVAAAGTTLASAVPAGN